MFSILSEYLKPPGLDTPDKESFWTDPYISKKLLEIHLDPDTDLASRKPGFMDSSADWIAKTVPPENYPSLIDLGCGPGLYAERFAKKGYAVTGVDFSENSIQYARNSAKEKNLSIKYLCRNYLEMQSKGCFDFASMIYCDYGALPPESRQILMQSVYNALKPGGKFLLDVCSSRMYGRFKEGRTWEICEGGFWSPENHLLFTSNVKYENLTVLNHYVVATQNETRVYYVWTHFFTRKNLAFEARKVGFKICGVYGDVAGKPCLGNGDTIALLLEKP
jgi:SAM-dependent methyltransferase